MATKKNTSINGNDYFRITRTVGHEYKNGKKVPVKKQFYGTSRADAQKKYEAWKEERLIKKQEAAVFTSNKTFKEMADYYCDNILAVNSAYSIGTRQLYMESYKRHAKHSQLSFIPISDLTPEHIQLFYNALDVSKSSLVTLHKFMGGFFKWSHLNAYSPKIIDSVIIPEKTVVKHQDDIVIWTDEEIEKIFTADPDFKYLPLLMVAYYTGMRISEILGLKWIDISNDTITIRRQCYRGTWTPPKNNKERVLPIHDKLKALISTLPRDYDIVFPSVAGTPLDYNNVTRKINSFYRKHGIPQKKFHAYRATFCTNLCKRGVPIQIASKLAGHSSISVTAKYYTSVSADEELNAISKL